MARSRCVDESGKEILPPMDFEPRAGQTVVSTVNGQRYVVLPDPPTGELVKGQLGNEVFVNTFRCKRTSAEGGRREAVRG